MSVLELDLGYTVKYNPLLSGKGLYLTVYPLSHPYTHTKVVRRLVSVLLVFVGFY